MPVDRGHLRTIRLLPFAAAADSKSTWFQFGETCRNSFDQTAGAGTRKAQHQRSSGADFQHGQAAQRPGHPRRSTRRPGTLSYRRVLPAGHQDQRHCCGCHREQSYQADGLSPTSSGRPSDLRNQPPKGTSPVFHAASLTSNDGALPSCCYKPGGSPERLTHKVEVVELPGILRFAVLGVAASRH